MLRCVAALCIAIAMAAAAQDTFTGGKSEPPPVKLPATGQLTGTILCDDTHRPARGAAVVAMPVSQEKEPGGSRERSSRVGMDGTYLIRGLSPGEYGLLVLFPGYPSVLEAITIDAAEDAAISKKSMDALISAGTVVVKSNATARMDRTLHRGSAVSGRVLYDDGSPASMLNVILEAASTKPFTAPGHMLISAGVIFSALTNQSNTTDDKGHFRLTNLTPGTYRLAASQPITNESLLEIGVGASAFSNLADPNGLRVYAGNTLHASHAHTVEVKAGEEVTDIEIVIPLNALHTISGHVVSHNGRPANTGTVVLADDSDRTFFREAGVMENGAFRLSGVPNGTYTLSVKHAGIAEPSDFVPNFNILQVNATVPSTPFEDGRYPVIVKDVDLPEIGISLKELPRIEKPAINMGEDPVTELPKP